MVRDAGDVISLLVARYGRNSLVKRVLGKDVSVNWSQRVETGIASLEKEVLHQVRLRRTLGI